MEKIYYTDRYKKQVTVTVVDIINADELKNIYFGTGKKIGLYFDKSIVFPGGGGQAKDISWIVSEKKSIKTYINDVIESDSGKNIHIIDSTEDIVIGDEVELFIDWKHREDNMHQHTAQHILSGCFYKLFNANTKGLHIGKEVTQLDIEGEFTEDMMRRVEKYANEIISDSVDVENYIDDEGIEETRRPLPEDKGEIRILKIGDLDINACCGVHVYNTRDVRLIKIIKYYRNKGGTRVEFVAGNRAVEYIMRREQLLDNILLEFNCGEQNILNAIENLKKEKDGYYEMKKYSSNKYYTLIADKLLEDSEVNSDDIHIITNVFENEEKWLVSELAKYIVDNYKSIVLFANLCDENVEIVLLTSKPLPHEFVYIDLGKDFKEYAELIRAKGGGSKFSANGRGEIKGLESSSVYSFIKSIAKKYL